MVLIRLERYYLIAELKHFIDKQQLANDKKQILKKYIKYKLFVMINKK